MRHDDIARRDAERLPGITTDILLCIVGRVFGAIEQFLLEAGEPLARAAYGLRDTLTRLGRTLADQTGGLTQQGFRVLHDPSQVIQDTVGVGGGVHAVLRDDRRVVKIF